MLNPVLAKLDAQIAELVVPVDTTDPFAAVIIARGAIAAARKAHDATVAAVNKAKGIMEQAQIKFKEATEAEAKAQQHIVATAQALGVAKDAAQEDVPSKHHAPKAGDLIIADGAKLTASVEALSSFVKSMESADQVKDMGENAALPCKR